jgi:hypothetical protein
MRLAVCIMVTVFTLLLMNPVEGHAQRSFSHGSHAQGGSSRGSYSHGGYSRGGYTHGGYSHGAYPRGGYAHGGYSRGSYYRGGYPHGYYGHGWYAGWPYASGSNFYFSGSVAWPVGAWWGAAYPYYYPYNTSRTVVIQQSPTEYVQQGTGTEEPYFWYYCQKSQAYYPYVKQCPDGWMQVVPPPDPGGAGE